MNYLRPDNVIDINIDTLLSTSIGGLLGAGVGLLIKESGLSVDIEKLESVLKNFGLLLLVLLSFIIYFISYKISYKIYKNKEE